MQEADTSPGKELGENGKRFFEMVIALYIAAIEKNYARIGQQNPYRIQMPPRHSASTEIYRVEPQLYQIILNLFHGLLNETNYNYTARISWNAMCFMFAVIFGRREIINECASIMTIFIKLKASQLYDLMDS